MRNIVLSLLEYKLIPIISTNMQYDTEIVDASRFVIDYFIKTKKLPAFKEHISYEISRYGEERMLQRYVAEDREHPYSSGCFHSYTEHEFKVDSLDYNEIIDGKGIIEPMMEDDSIILKKHIINTEENNLIAGDILIVNLENDEFVFYLNDKQIDIDDTELFFNNSVVLSGYEQYLKTLIYNYHVTKPACKDIYLDYLLFFKQQSFSINRNKNAYLTTLYYSYMASEKFLLLFEFNLKQNIGVYCLSDQNPIYTNKPYEDVSKMKSVSKTSLDIINKIRSRQSEKSRDIKTFSEMESNPQIGINGIKYIYEVCDTITNIDYSLCGRACCINVYERINDIMKIFDISLKTLMERAIKSMFYEEINIESYFNYVLDYVEMKRILGLEIESKLPKNIIELHDGLSGLIEDVKEQEMKDRFEIKAKENKALADAFNLIRKDKTYVIISPKESKDLITEGQNMHHCVGSYIERLANGYSKIFFIRKEKEPEESFVTLELDNKNNYVQAKAKFNADVPKDVDAFITDFIIYLGGEEDDK